MVRATRLSHQTNSQELPPLAGAPDYRDLLDVGSEEATWRLVEVFSEKGLPFELELRWSGGAGSGANAKLTIAHSTRVCLFARALTLRAANLSNTAGRVGVTVADGFAPTTNVWEQRGTCDGLTPIQVAIPPFARAFVLHLADRTALPGTVISIYDGAGTLRGQLAAAAQPDSGIPVGGAGRIEVLTSGATDLRGVFLLTL